MPETLNPAIQGEWETHSGISGRFARFLSWGPFTSSPLSQRPRSVGSAPSLHTGSAWSKGCRERPRKPDSRCEDAFQDAVILGEAAVPGVPLSPPPAGIGDRLFPCKFNPKLSH